MRLSELEEDRQHTDGEADEVQLAQREAVDGVRERDRDERRGTSDVGCDEYRAAREPVDPDAGRQTEEQKRQELERREKRHLERAGLEHEYRRQWQGHERDL